MSENQKPQRVLGTIIGAGSSPGAGPGTRRRRAVEAVGVACRRVLAAEGQALGAQIAEYEAARSASCGRKPWRYSTRGLATLSVWHGSLSDRLTSAPPLARVDRAASARWADYARRLAEDADAAP